MALFNNLELTDFGVGVIHQLVAAGGAPVVFSTVALGDGELPGGTSIPKMISLVNERIRANVETLEHDGESHISVVSARISSADLDADLIHRELGVFVLFEGREVLFAYANAGHSYDYIPTAGANAAITKQIVASFSFSSLDTIYKDLPSDQFVTYAAFVDRIDRILPGLAHDAVQSALFDNGNVVLTNKPNVVTSKSTFTEPVSVAPAVKPGDALNLEQLEMARGIRTPGQMDHRSLGYCSRAAGNPLSYMDRLYNAGTTPIGLGQMNWMSAGDGNNYAWSCLTMTLDLPLLTEAIKQPNDVVGQTAFFGLGGTLPSVDLGIYSTSDGGNGILKAYDVQSCGCTHGGSQAATATRTVPALFSSDYHSDKKLRLGFAPAYSGPGATQSYDNAMTILSDSKVSKGLLARLPDDVIQVILVWGGYFVQTKFLPSNCTGMWVKRANGETVFVGWSETAYAYAKVGLVLAPFGNSGVGAFRVHLGDIFGLAGGSRPSLETIYPLKGCMHVADAAEQTKHSTILFADKSSTITPVDRWISVTDDGSGNLTVFIEQNTSGKDRRGLCDITLSNGVTYSIHVTQKANQS